MKYFVYTALAIALWLLVECLRPVLQGRADGTTVLDRLKQFGRQTHSTFGILAILILLILVIRLLVQVVMRY
jgi:hypothetical protein